MEFIDLNQEVKIETEGHSSKGNQLKWKKGEYWYKADHMGYEGLAEIIVSRLLKRSSIQNFVEYQPAVIRYGEKNYRGCKSKNFLQEEESLITIDRLFRQYTGRNLTSELGRIPDVKERILYLTENVEEITGLEHFGKYLTGALEIDALFLNEDRHTNNIAVIWKGEEKGYYLCPYFDHGLSLYSDITVDFGMELSDEECRKRIHAKPFSQDFDEQLDCAEELYGKQIYFRFSEADILAELREMQGIYEDWILHRVEETLRMQKRKYQYLFTR
ncbi:MAG: hypothetical protein Q4E86_04560 [Lachnospiraceae bacterium]|nr:hypothetical protein [Lachnospiraceae bacterium]